MSGRVIWICGVPSSGKTTLAEGLNTALRARGEPVLWLDSDDLRGVLTPSASYTDEERDRFYSAIGHLARRAEAGGITVIISATAMRSWYRDAVRASVPKFIEVELRCGPEALRRRDDKGLYRAADAGTIQRLPGVGVPFESSGVAEVVADTTDASPEAVLALVLAELDRRLDA